MSFIRRHSSILTATRFDRRLKRSCSLAACHVLAQALDASAPKVWRCGRSAYPLAPEGTPCKTRGFILFGQGSIRPRAGPKTGFSALAPWHGCKASLIRAKSVCPFGREISAKRRPALQRCSLLTVVLARNPRSPNRRTLRSRLIQAARKIAAPLTREGLTSSS